MSDRLVNLLKMIFLKIACLNWIFVLVRHPRRSSKKCLCNVKDDHYKETVKIMFKMFQGTWMLCGLEVTICSTLILNMSGDNLREKFSPGPGIEPGSPALRAGAITTKPPRRSAGQAGILLLLDSYCPPEALVPSIRDGGEHLCWHYFTQEFLC